MYNPTANANYGFFCTAVSAYFWVNKRVDSNGEGVIPNFQVTHGTQVSEGHRLVRVSGMNRTTDPTCGFSVTASNNANVRVTVDVTSAAPVELLPAGTNADIVIQTIHRINTGEVFNETTGDGHLHCPDGQMWDSNRNGCVDLSGNLTGDVRIRSNYVPMIVVLTTLRGNTQTTLAGDGKCAIDNAVGLGGQFNYCALNKFEFSAMVGARQ